MGHVAKPSDRKMGIVQWKNRRSANFANFIFHVRRLKKRLLGSLFYLEVGNMTITIPILCKANSFEPQIR